MLSNYFLLPHTANSYRVIFMRLLLTVLLTDDTGSLCDIVIVSRLNTKVGIPDEAMLFSDTTLAPCVLRLIMVGKGDRQSEETMYCDIFIICCTFAAYFDISLLHISQITA